MAKVARCGHRFNTLAANPVLRIHPAIGVARVGGSDKYFIGPEIPGKGAVGSDGDTPDAHGVPPYKDGGKIKRQATRFRIFHYPSDGSEPNEMDVDHQDVEWIKWEVHLANRKAAYFKFSEQDGAAADGSFTGAGLARRNPWCPAADRTSKLVIDGGKKIIKAEKAKSVNPEKFIPSPPHAVINYLGELRLDKKGRLLVLGGHGVSKPNRAEYIAAGNPPGDPPIRRYANNPFWFDDVSDGPVTATVKFKGLPSVVVEGGAWVMVGPPDFAPPIGNVITMYDTMLDVAVRKSSIKIPGALKVIYDRWPLLALKELRAGLGAYQVDYDEEIKPLFDRTIAYKWVHKPTWGRHGSLVPTAQWVFSFLRPPAGNTILGSGAYMPMLLGDEGPSRGSKKEGMALTKTQYEMVRNWKDAKTTNRTVPKAYRDSVTPEGLDRAAQEACVGGAFCPGIEAGWLVRDPRVYSEPFRIDHTAVLLAAQGVKVEPGFFSQQMALPWQADFLMCKQEIHDLRPGEPDRAVDCPPPSGGWPVGTNAKRKVEMGWWPGQRPDDTFKNAADATSGTYQAWARIIGGYLDMVNKFNELGFVLKDGANYIEKEGP